MAGIMLGLFLASLDTTIVATAMPQIITDLEGFDRYAWVTTAYLVAFTTTMPIVGRLTDLYGRKWFYTAGIAIFLLGSALAGSSQNMTQLIIYRAFQGIGGGAMVAIAFIAVADLFPAAERGKYLAMLEPVFAVSAVIGLSMGGVVTDYLSWHWIFYINLPLGIPVIVLIIAFFPQLRPTGPKRRIDYLGIVSLVLAVVPLLLALSWGGVQYPWDSPQVIGALIVAATMAATFIIVELRLL